MEPPKYAETAARSLTRSRKNELKLEKQQENITDAGIVEEYVVVV